MSGQKIEVNKKPAKNIDGFVRQNTTQDPLGLKKDLKQKRKRFLKQTKFTSKQALQALAVILVVGVAVWFFAVRSTELSNSDVVVRVSELVSDLPQENPTIAIINDADALSEQDGFYAGASNGDRLLVYPQSGRAIIYNPDSDSIVKDGAVNISE